MTTFIKGKRFASPKRITDCSAFSTTLSCNAATNCGWENEVSIEISTSVANVDNSYRAIPIKAAEAGKS